MRWPTLILIAALALAAFLFGRGCAPEPPPAQVITVRDEPLRLGDLPDATVAGGVTFYAAEPETVRVCIAAPEDLVVDDPHSVPAPGRMWVTPPDPLAAELRAGLGDRALRFLLLPLDAGGNPAVRVARRQTTVSAWDPVTARGIQFTYPHPRPRWRFGVTAELGDDLTLPGLQPLVRVPVRAGYRRLYVWGEPGASAGGVQLRAGVGVRLY